MKELKNFDALWAAMREFQHPTDEEVTYDDVLRIMAMVQAEECADMNHRETIDLFVSGIPPMTRERVNQLLDEMNDPDIVISDDPNTMYDWEQAFKRFFG